MSTVPTTGPATPAPGASAPPRTLKNRFRKGGSGGLFVAPFMIFFGLFLLVPLVYGLWMSFTDASLTGHGDSSFAGLGNYTEALTDSEVWKSLGNTALFTVLSSVPLVVIALAMALLVHANLPGQWLWRFAFFAPYVLPVAVVWQVWSMMFQPDLGLVNNFLGAIGLDSVGWLVDEKWAMYAVVLVTVWWTAGFNFLLYLSALQAVPDHLYEAAALDGAGAWRRLWSITLPQLKRTTGLIAVLQVLASLKVFDQIYLLTRGGPNGSTRPILEYIYDTGFTGYRLGYASAISYVFFAILVILSLAQFKLFSRKEA